MSSIPRLDNKISASTVWRDALGPGYAVGVAETVLQVAGNAAARPYRTRR